jgi:hypothetical protein
MQRSRISPGMRRRSRFRISCSERSLEMSSSHVATPMIAALGDERSREAWRSRHPVRRAGATAGCRDAMADEFSGLRIDYDSAELDVATVPEDPIELLRTWLHDSMAAQDVEPHAMTLATVGADGAPRRGCSCCAVSMRAGSPSTPIRRAAKASSSRTTPRQRRFSTGRASIGRHAWRAAFRDPPTRSPTRTSCHARATALVGSTHRHHLIGIRTGKVIVVGRMHERASQTWKLTLHSRGVPGT